MLSVHSAAALLLAVASTHSAGAVYNTFDGPDFPACRDVAQILHPTTIEEMQSIVKNASASGTPIRASGNAHMWYDTMCSDDPRTIIVKTDAVNRISDLQLNGATGTVVVEAGVTFTQVAEWLQDRGAALGYTLVNWNITLGGAIAMGAHRSSLPRGFAGELVHIEKDDSDTWLAATTSLGLLGIIARIKISILADYKVWANQTTWDEDDILNADLYEMISPYVTANFWWWPSVKKFHMRTYGVVPPSTFGNAFQSTFSVTPIEGALGLSLLNAGQNSSTANFFSADTFYALWSAPNFHETVLDLPLISWPVIGRAFDVLIGGLYPNQRPEWEYGLHGATLELAVPVDQGPALLRRVRELFDQSAADGKAVTSTYRSGINIKFGKPMDSFLGQTTQRVGNRTADWSKGAMMFDFPSFVPTTGDRKRFNEQWYLDLARILVDEFPVRPHWTKNTRAVFQNAVKNLDADSLKRFAAVRKTFDPNGTFKSVVGEIIGV
ncbi:D-arabinono-1,4-lactone oxidase [Mycena kentingensis (nom. inval.)]|nr:D-arabinono-1,4-lactone oxidase [Mycena kentingensis (nom. inval.)]